MRKNPSKQQTFTNCSQVWQAQTSFCSRMDAAWVETASVRTAVAWSSGIPVGELYSSCDIMRTAETQATETIQLLQA